MIAVLLTAAAIAAASWLNFHQPRQTNLADEPLSEEDIQAAIEEARAYRDRYEQAARDIAPPATEATFMAAQLRRLLEGGDSRTDTEKAIAALLPANPDVSDLRQAYVRHLLDVQAAQAKAFMAANPEYAGNLLPPQDKEARAAYDEAVKLAEKVKERVGQEYRPGTEWQSPDPTVRAALLEETAPLLPLMAKAIPAKGRTLVTRKGPGDVEVLFSRPVSVATARARLLLAEGRQELAVQTLKDIHGCCVAELSPPTLMACALREIYIHILYDEGVLAFAKTGHLTVEELAAFSNRAALPEFDPIRSAHIELRQQLDFFATTDLGQPGKLAATRLLTTGNFDEYGATSLDDWVRREANIEIGGHWKEQAEFIAQALNAAVDVRNLESEKADQFLALVNSEPRRNCLSAMRSIGEYRARSEAYLFAARVYELRMTDPGKWRKRAEAEVIKWPLLEAMDTGNQVIIRQNTGQVLLKTASKEGIFSVP